MDIEKRICNKKHIFFSCENLNDRFTDYADHLLTTWDKGLGFEFRPEENYLRFPLWIMYYVDPNSKNPGKDFEDKMNRPATLKNNFTTLVASHDERGNGAGYRTLCYNNLKTIGPIFSGGKLLKNTSLLTTQFQDDANAFIGSSQFNIALENSNAKGYCTEKVFRPFLTGTIPIYWGDNQLPEPSVINQDALLFFNPEQPEQLMKQVEELRNDEKKLRDFSNQRRTVPGAADWVNDKLQKLMEFLND